MRYEVIVVGASFAGLAVAAPLRGKRVLLVDRKPIGSGQASTCGTLVSTLEALGLGDAILQVHQRIVVHTPGRTFVYPLPEPYCTFDYALLCRRLREQGDAEFLLTAALRVEGDVVHTSRGAFAGEIIVDASGWRAVLGRQLAAGLTRPDRLNFGIETTVPYRDDGLHFWYDPRGLLPRGVTWVFPTGHVARVGIGSFQGTIRLADGLQRFLGQLGLAREGIHGGYFPHGLREPVVGELFLVGDAAGQCPGLTAEGIRPALFFGTHLGRLLRLALDGETSPAEVRGAYRELVATRKTGYELLCLAQRVLPWSPLPVVQGVLALASWRPLLGWWLQSYLRAFRLEAPRAVPGREMARVA